MLANKNQKKKSTKLQTCVYNYKRIRQKIPRKKEKADLFFIDKKKKYGIIDRYENEYAPLAQLDRALVYGTNGENSAQLNIFLICALSSIG